MTQQRSGAEPDEQRIVSQKSVSREIITKVKQPCDQEGH